MTLHVLLFIIGVLAQVEYYDYDSGDELEDTEASIAPTQKYIAPRYSSRSRQGKSIDAEAMVDKLVNAVKRTETEDMLKDLSEMLGNPEMQNNPRRLKSEIVKLLKSSKYKKASEGRKTVKAIKLPPGIVKLLNSK